MGTGREFERGKLVSRRPRPPSFRIVSPSPTWSLPPPSPLHWSRANSANAFPILLFWTCWNLDYLGESKKETKRKVKEIFQPICWLDRWSFLPGVLREPYSSTFPRPDVYPPYPAGFSIKGLFFGLWCLWRGEYIGLVQNSFAVAVDVYAILWLGRNTRA